MFGARGGALSIHVTSGIGGWVKTSFHADLAGVSMSCIVGTDTWIGWMLRQAKVDALNHIAPPSAPKFYVL